MSTNDSTRSTDRAFMQNAVLQPFPSIQRASTYVSPGSELETRIQNLEAHHKAVRSALFSQAFSDVDRTRHATDAASPPPPPASTVNTIRHQNDEAVLSTLYTRWNPRTPPPIFSLQSPPNALPHSYAQNSSRFQPSSRKNSLQSVDAALSKLIAYDQHVAKYMEDKYAARERYKSQPEGQEDRNFARTEETKDRTLDYDASRDPRLRK